MLKNASRWVLGSVFAVIASTVNAAPILCSENVNLNRMSVDSSMVGGCLASGVGNINGNNDAFQQAFPGFGLASKSDSANPFDVAYTQTGSTGFWSISASFWDSFSTGAIGFKFGTGNTPDNWFVYSLVNGTTGGAWDFLASEVGKGGGLSHINLYGKDIVVREVPEPSGMVLFLLGLGGLLVARKRV